MSLESQNRTSEEPSAIDSAAPAPARTKHHMSLRARLLFFLVAWLIVLMPFLFWWSTWFGRHLSPSQINQYLHDDKHPRHIQHALVQMGERMAAGDSTAKQWYPDLLRLAAYNVEEVRNTDAWVMGQDTSQQDFHAALLKMLQDGSPIVRGNAALSLVRFGDASGHDQIVSLLVPAKITAPTAGTVEDTGKAGRAVRQGGLIAKLRDQNGRAVELRSPVTGRIRSIEIERGDKVSGGTELAVVSPGDDQVWEAMRALYVIGRPEDLPAVTPYEHQIPDVSERVRQQAVETERAIRDRK